MRIEQFEAVVTAFDNKSMQAAADLLHTSVQNVSKLINQLEDELEVKIFLRSKYGLILTAEGEIIYNRCKDIMDNINLMKSDYLPLSHHYAAHSAKFEHLNILTELSSAIVCADILENICNDLEITATTLISQDAAEINREIDNNPTKTLHDYDIIITNVAKNDIHKYQVQRNTSVYLLDEERIGIRINDRHPLANQELVSLKEILRLPLVMPLPTVNSSSQMQLLIERTGVKLRPNFIMNSHKQVNTYLQNHSAYTFVSYSEHIPVKSSAYYIPNTTILPLKEQIYIQHILITSKNNSYIPVQKFLQIARRKFEQLKLI